MTAAKLHLPQTGKSSAGFKPGSKQYIARLQSFRGYGCVMVAMVHVAQTQWTPGKTLLTPADPASEMWRWAGKLYMVVFNGHAALTMFFVLSGFVLFLSLERGPAGFGAAAARFTMARTLRIYPPVVATVGLFALLFALFGLTIGPIGPAQFSPGSVLANMGLIKTTINGVTWTLQLEMAAVPVIFLGYWLFRSYGPRPLVAVLIALVGLSFLAAWARLIGPDTRSMGLMYTFIAGMLVPSIGRSLVETMSWRRVNLLMLSMAAVLMTARLFTLKWAPLIETLSGSLLIAGIAYRPDIAWFKFLDWKPAIWFGRVSYSFYLLHPLTLIAIWDMSDTFAGWIDAGVPGVLLAILFGFGTTLVVAPLAYLWYRLFEATAIRAIERIERRPAAAVNPIAGGTMRADAVRRSGP